MTTAWIAVGQILILVVALAAVHVPLGGYMARVFTSSGRVECGAEVRCCRGAGSSSMPAVVVRVPRRRGGGPPRFRWR